jgi:hypothetical protein
MAETGVGIHPHVPLRPLFICKIDAQPWPCADARLGLVTGFRDRRISRCLFLGAMFIDCMNDLYKLNPDTAPQPAALYARFFGWLPKET